jgi:flagellar secretion chaperone FliS
MTPTSSYREIAIRGAGPVRLVVLLYEQMIEDLRQAVQAIERDEIELRTNKINHAISVIGYLQSSLNKEAGGKVALHLESFYDQLRANLAQAQFSVSQRILKQQITDLLTLREAWSEVERAESAVSQEKIGALVAETASSNVASSWRG